MPSPFLWKAQGLSLSLKCQAVSSLLSLILLYGAEDLRCGKSHFRPQAFDFPVPDKTVPDRNGQHSALRMAGFHISRHMLSESAVLHIFLHSYKKTVVFRQLVQKRRIQRFYKSRVHKSGVIAPFLQFCIYLLADFRHASHGKYRCACPSEKDFALSVLHRALEFLQSLIRMAFGITDGAGAVRLYRELQHLLKFLLVLWSHDCHIRHHGEIGKIKASMVCLSVRAYDPRPVDGEDHMEILHTDILQHLIHRPLQEG